MTHDLSASQRSTSSRTRGVRRRVVLLALRLARDVVTIVLAFVAVGCESGAASRTFVERDSAGIRIVDNHVPQWGDRSGWSIAQEPLIDIGMSDGPEEYQLFSVRMAVRQSDGTIVVLNGGTQEIRFYDSDGQHIRSVGGAGMGPGEYRELEFIAVLGGDSLLAFNRTPARVTILTPQGDFVRSFAMPAPADRTNFFDFEVAGLLSERRLVVWSQPIYVQGYATFTDGMNRHPHPIAIANLTTNAFDSIAQAPGWDVWVERRADGGSGLAAPPFARSSDVVARGDHIYVAPTEQLGVVVMGANGTPAMITRATAVSPEVTSADVQALKDDLFDRYPVPEDQRGEVERLFAEMPPPERFPLFRGADVDAEGNVWLHAYPRPGEDPKSAHVFSAEGRWLGEVAVPPGLKRINELEPVPLDIGSDWVLGVWQDEADVDHVRLYRLER